MKIFARGEKIRTDELKARLSGLNAEWLVVDELLTIPDQIGSFDVFFDLNFDEQQNNLASYAGLKGKPVIVSAAKKSLAQLQSEYGKPVDCVLIGINALPTFINRNLAEVSLLNEQDAAQLQTVFAQLDWSYKLVSDRVGFVTPRIIMMIINEACYTVQEGTANMKDIDTSMKLGTNYPFGPFEWANRIGVKHVYETIDAVYRDTHDERYKICPLLKTMYLTGRSFAV
jgi:3-hydroxybutyryl-CoA dehydrogenase